MTPQTEALKQARSVISSINQGKQHALTRNEETVFWQREEWVRWALDEVLPLIDEALAQPEQEPVVLKLGECWPENVMQMWDYYRKEIANGNTGSEPRDWFESLAEMRLVDTTPPQRTWVGLTKDERLKLYRQFEDCLESDDWEYEKAIEAKLKEKNT